MFQRLGFKPHSEISYGSWDECERRGHCHRQELTFFEPTTKNQ